MKKRIPILIGFLLVFLLNPYINFTAEQGGKDRRIYLKQEGDHWIKAIKNYGSPGISSLEGGFKPQATVNKNGELRLATINSLFLPSEEYDVGSWPDAVAIGDVNGDGLNDVVMTTSYAFDPDNDYKIFVFPQSVNGILDIPVKYDAGDRDSVDVGDLDNDGKKDVVVTHSNTIGVFIQNDSGTLDAMTTYSATNDTLKVRIGDFNNDDLMDVASIAWGNQENGEDVNVFLQNAGGTLDSPVIYAVTHGGYDDLEVGDINNDGLTDIIVMSGQSSSNQLGVLYQNAGGTFDSAVYYDLGVDESTEGVAVGDVNGDSLNDVVVTYGGNQPSSYIGVFLQNVSGTLDSPISYESYDCPEPVVVSDIDCDQRQDVVVAHGGWLKLGAYLQENEGTFLIEDLYDIPYATHYNPHGIAVGDINNDTGNNVVIADYNNGLVVLYGTRRSEYKLTLAAEAGGATDPVPGTHTYANGTEVTLTATPDEGYRFSGWTGLISSFENPLTITMDSDISLTAKFSIERTLTISPTIGGRTDPATGTHLVDLGTEVSIRAIPFTDYGFSHWSGDASGDANPLVITIDSDKSITANFKVLYALGISAGTGGTTVPSPGTYIHFSGTEISVSAVAESGYQFSGWSGTVSGTTSPVTISMDSSKALMANFTSTSGSGGDGSDDSDDPEEEDPASQLSCFIATASYGSALHPHVETLRDFRDTYLMPSRVGRMFVYLYYRYSPAVADVIAKNRFLKVSVRISLVPLVTLSYSMLHFGLEKTAFLLALIFALPILFVFSYRRRSRRK